CLDAPYQQDGKLHVMPHAVCSAASQQVVQKTVPMGGHRDEIDRLLSGHLDEPRGTTAHGTAPPRLDPALHELVADPAEVLAVAADLLRLAEVELVEGPRGPTVSQRHEHQMRPGQPPRA